MTGPIGNAGAPAGAAGAAPPDPDARLRKVARQMEGVFVQELYKAMRATVPQGDGAVDGGSAEEMFTGLMDQHLATETPRQWERGLGEAIYRALRARVHGASPDAPPGAPLASALPAPTAPPAAPPVPHRADR